MEDITPEEKRLLNELNNINFKTLKECLKIYKTEYSDRYNNKKDIREFLERLEKGKLSEEDVEKQEKGILKMKKCYLVA